MRNKMPHSYLMAALDIVLGLAILFLSILFKMNLSDFVQGFCIGISGVIILTGIVLGVRHFIRKK